MLTAISRIYTSVYQTLFRVYLPSTVMVGHTPLTTLLHLMPQHCYYSYAHIIFYGHQKLRYNTSGLNLAFRTLRVTIFRFVYSRLALFVLYTPLGALFPVFTKPQPLGIELLLLQRTSTVLCYFQLFYDSKTSQLPFPHVVHPLGCKVLYFGRA